MEVVGSDYDLTLPPWANPFHKGSFSKLRILNLTRYDKVLSSNRLVV